MSYQRFFRRYQRLAGMTGTGREVAGEFWAIYGLRFLRIPPNRPVRRRKVPGAICPTLDDKWRLISDRAKAHGARGRPVLIGTRSVSASEALSEALTTANVDHVVLNAKQDADEAEVIRRAGEAGRITVATNMAGRGVDILLPDKVIAGGGLHVILSERHEAGRIDRQLIGRCGRQGEPGTYETIVSLEDSLLDMIEHYPLLHFAAGSTIGRRIAGRAVFNHAQRKAERLHSRMRRDIFVADQRIGSMLAFAGEGE